MSTPIRIGRFYYLRDYGMTYGVLRLTTIPQYYYVLANQTDVDLWSVGTCSYATFNDITTEDRGVIPLALYLQLLHRVQEKHL